MEQAEKITFAIFLCVSLILIFAGMVLGPLGYEVASSACSGAALVIGLVIVCYCLYYWKDSADR